MIGAHQTRFETVDHACQPIGGLLKLHLLLLNWTSATICYSARRRRWISIDGLLLLKLACHRPLLVDVGQMDLVCSRHHACKSILLVLLAALVVRRCGLMVVVVAAEQSARMSRRARNNRCIIVYSRRAQH